MAQQCTTINLVNHSERIAIDCTCDMLPLPLDLSYGAISTSELADHCMSEINNYRNGVLSNDQYCLELFHRALMQRDSLAWEVLQRRFSKMVLHWMRVHPMRDIACRHDSEENYVAQAFARFWQATVNNQNIEFRSLASVLKYLRASLHGAILDTIRAYSRLQEMPLPEPGEPGELLAEEQEDDSELWPIIQSLISDERQKRVAYLLFHCHLKPREIVTFCPQEFGDVQEIYSLRRTIFERLLRNADFIRWRLDNKPE
jgi:DNA-directed RNA polymerase specialized sigma24 family protein